MAQIHTSIRQGDTMKLTLTRDTNTFIASGTVIDKTGNILAQLDKTVEFASKDDAKDYAKAQATSLSGKAVYAIVQVKHDPETYQAETDMTIEDIAKALGVTFGKVTKGTKRTAAQIVEDIKAERDAGNIGVSANGNFMLILDKRTGIKNRTLNSAEVKALESIGGLN